MSAKHLTQGQYSDLMRFAFDQVCDKADWKGPIDVVVPDSIAELYSQAISFMTATETVQYFSPNIDDKTVRLVSIGYRAGPAGDH